jgi:TonB family protein
MQRTLASITDIEKHPRTMSILLAAIALIAAQAPAPPQAMTEEYLSDALREGAQGLVRVNLRIGTNGRVKGCKVIKSSGHRSLDLATCRNLQARARFTPATDDAGNLIENDYEYEMNWRLK